MSTEALDIFEEHLTAQLGEDGIFTENAVYDPTGTALNISGVFDDANTRENKDGANVFQKNEYKRFIVSDILDFNIYSDTKIFLTKRNITYKIDYIEKDLQGVQVLWLV